MSSIFSPSPQELAIVTQIFALADPNKLGVITGDAAIKIFAGTKLSPTVLGEIWDIADQENKGWLAKKNVAIAVRLIAWAQKGEKVSTDLLAKPGPLPTIDGITTLAQQHTGISLPRSPPPALPPLTPQDKLKFQRMFASYNPVNGLLSGEKARDVFVKSKLSIEQLSQIWNLADTQDRGALDVSDFTIGMYLIQGIMSGQLPVIPNSLPPGLYEQAGGVQQTTVLTPTRTSGSFSPISSTFSTRNSIPSQFTGQSQISASRLSSRVTPFSSQPADNSALPWDVTPAEKAASDQFFDQLDAQKRGYIEGDIAVPFMLNSKLPGDDLAKIWDLADVTADGRLTRDTFAVAMHLIYAKCSGKEIPATLPPSLLPPSMRANGAVPSSPQVDLFTWDDSPPPSAAKPVASAIQMQPSTLLPFVLSPPQVSSPNPRVASTSNSSLQKHLLDDDEAVPPPTAPLQDKSAEIGNTKNQLASTNRSLETTKTERTSVEQTLVSQASQLSSLQTQLSSAKAAYETETKLLASLRDRWTSQNADIQKAREELIRAESDLSALRVEKAEVEGTFLRDKEEARELHRKMFEATQQAEVVKADVDKLKKEAKQQKGLLAIARKQLSVKEAEHAKMLKELEEAKAGHQTIVAEREAAEAELEKLSSAPPPLPKSNEIPTSASADTLAKAIAQPLPGTPTPSSPPTVASTLAKSNNPFERLAIASGKSTPISQTPSPFVSLDNHVPTPPIDRVLESEADTSAQDPFGFDEVFSVEKSTTNVENVQPNGSGAMSGPETYTPKPTQTIVSLPPVTDTLPPLSPTDASDNEYATPPTTTSSAVFTSPVQVTTKFPDIGEAANHFPELPTDASVDLFNAETSKPRVEHEPAISARGMELAVDESDSESEDEDEPLGKRKAASDGVTHNAAAPTVPSFDDIFTQPLGVAQNGVLPPTAATTDAFGMSSANIPPLSKDATSQPAHSVPTLPPPTLGVSAFDEAMLGISGNGSTSTAPKLTFDSAFDTAFDDNFDFGTAPVTFSSPPVGDVKAANASTTIIPKREGFDDIFRVPPANDAAAPPPLAALEPSTPLSLSPTNGLAQLSITQTSSAPAPASPASRVSPEEPKPLESNLQPSVRPPSPAVVLGSQPASPENSRIVPNRAVSPPPPQQRSSPPQVSSPKTRPSTSSGKEHPHDKPKDPPPRHSKLSIRLPFGRKKNKHLQENVPPPPPLDPQLYGLEPSNNSPALADDVDAVKQLCGMGFSRTDAVAALEKNGYSVSRALNVLLAPDGGAT